MSDCLSLQEARLRNTSYGLEQPAMFPYKVRNNLIRNHIISLIYQNILCLNINIISMYPVFGELNLFAFSNNENEHRWTSVSHFNFNKTYCVDRHHLNLAYILTWWTRGSVSHDAVVSSRPWSRPRAGSLGTVVGDHVIEKEAYKYSKMY